jgi:hypothetical protein
MQNTQPADASLDSKYGKIGISAVAAAVRYVSDSRNPAYAPAVAQDVPQEKWQADLAA